MEHFTKASSETDDEKKQKWDIRVKAGSKIRNIISQALRLLQTEEKIVLTGMGPTVTRAITCAEIVKRKVKNLHQNNKLFYSNTVDVWEPKEGQALDKLQVTRRVPSISITLSTVPLAPEEPGYQFPGQSRSPVQFGNEDLALASEEEKNDRRDHKMQQRRHSDEGRGNRDRRQAGYQAERSQGHNKSRHQKRNSKSDGHREEVVEEERRGAQAKNSDQSPGSAGRTPNKRGGYHGGSKSRHYSQNKKQKGEASAPKRTQAKAQPTTEDPQQLSVE